MRRQFNTQPYIQSIERLKSPAIQNNLKVRHDVKQISRTYLSELGFLEIDTPILGPSVNEYSSNELRVEDLWGRGYYYLPQSPQLFKQLLMAGGIERYFQFAHCFRNEGYEITRNDQAIEFMHIDIEMQTTSAKEIQGIVEKMVEIICSELGIECRRPFPVIEAVECLEKYNTDKPDLRKEWETDYAFLWVVNFPFVEKVENKRLFPAHHVFARPKINSYNELRDDKIMQVKTDSYDLVLNGMEIGGGDMRIWEPELQEIVMDLFEYPKQKLWYFLEILKNGVPPHGGMGIGLDRFVMQLTGADDIMDVNAFPKQKNGVCLLTGCPS